jgi:hypothetical protein
MTENLTVAATLYRVYTNVSSKPSLLFSDTFSTEDVIYSLK